MDPYYANQIPKRGVRCFTHIVVKTPPVLRKAYISPFLWVAKSLWDHSGHAVVCLVSTAFLMRAKNCNKLKEKVICFIIGSGLMTIHSLFLFKEMYLTRIHLNTVKSMIQTSLKEH